MQPFLAYNEYIMLSKQQKEKQKYTKTTSIKFFQGY